MGAGKKWWRAVWIFGFAMMFFDTHYLMPNYLPTSAGGNMSHAWSLYGPGALPLLLFQYLVSLARFIFGVPLIIIQALGGSFAFGAGPWATAAASALVFYTLFVPYLVVLSFFIEGADGIPPAYRLFQFFITRSGKSHIHRTLGDRGATFDAAGFARTTRETRQDRYQARMEAEELKKAAEKARADAARMHAESARYSQDEEERVRAAEEAAHTAEEHHRARSRKRAWENRKGKR